jgi:hypothetical protein
MLRKPSRSVGPRSVLIEELESRQMLSVATTTTLSASATQIEFGQSVTLTVTVKAKTGKKIPTGAVELLINGKSTGQEFALTHGKAVIPYPASEALRPGPNPSTFRYVGSSAFAPSKSKSVTVDVSLPKVTKLADGLEIATITPGKGTKTVQAGTTGIFADIGYDPNGAVQYESAIHGNGFFTMEVGATPSQTIPAFDEGAIGMKAGEVRVIIAPSSLVAGSGTGDWYFVLILHSIVS